VRRRLLNLLTALSLLLCVAAAVFWVRGRTCADRVYVSFGRGDVYAFLNCGQVLVNVDDIPGEWQAPEWAVFDARTSAMGAGDLEVLIGGRQSYALNRFGFALGRFDGRNHVTHAVAGVPDWFLVLLFGAARAGVALPGTAAPGRRTLRGLRLRPHRQRQRRLPGVREPWAGGGQR